MESSIEIILGDGGDESISLARTTAYIIPRKGEYVWMPYDWDRKKEFGTRAFIVDDVAHHVFLYPQEGNNKPRIFGDNIVLYVSKVE